MSITEESNNSKHRFHIRDKFDSDYKRLTRKGSHSKNLLDSYIRNNLRQYNCYSFQPDDILHEAYIRAIHYIVKEGEEIRDIKSWMKRTCLNIIYENVRQNVNNDKLVNTLKSESQDLHASEDENDKEIKVVLDVINKLPQRDKNLILYYLKGKNNREISEILSEIEDKNVTATTTRKRKSRVIQKIREQLL